MGCNSWGLMWCIKLCVSALLVICQFGGGAKARIRQFCKWFEEDSYVQKDIGSSVICSLMPGLGPYSTCADVTDLSLALREVYPNTRTLCIRLSDDFIPPASFSRFPSLEMLRLEGELAKVSSGAFSGLSNLRFLIIDVTPNSPKCVNCTLELGLFKSLVSLESLTLKGVCVSVVPPTLLVPLVRLRKVVVDQAGAKDLAEVFCLLTPEMKDLRNLSLSLNQLEVIRNRGCVTGAGAKAWPTEVLSRIQVLHLSNNPIQIVERDSLSVFQNLSSLKLSFLTPRVGQLSESGIAKLATLNVMSYGDVLTLTLTEMCTLVAQLEIGSLTMTRINVRDFNTLGMSRCGNSLRELLLNQDTLQDIEQDFWTQSLGIQSLEIELAQLRNASFCAAGRGAQWNLTSLFLSLNHLTVIEAEQFACMPLLEELDLSDNRIASLAPRAFHGLSRLRLLQLTNNHLTKLGTHDFEELSLLEVLALDGNRIDHDGIEEGVFRNQHQLRDLSLGQIDIIYQFYFSLVFYGYPPKLQRFLLNVGPGTNLHVGKIRPPESQVSMEIRGDYINAHDCNNNLYPKVQELIVRGQEKKGTPFTCKSREFLAPYFPNLESFEYWADPDKVEISYDPINQLRELKRLKLVNLNFSNRTHHGMIFRNLTQLRSLILVNCKLSFLTKTMFQDLASLRLLRLYSENPLFLSEGVFQPLVNLSAVVFDRLDLRCDCSNEWLLEWAERSPRVQVLSLQHQQCVWHYQKLNFLSIMERICQTDVDFLLYISTAMASSLLICSSLGYHFLRWPFTVLFFRVRGWAERRLGRRWWRKKRGGRRGGEGIEEDEEEDGEALFDAFVSFSSRDEAWVMGEMRPRLEQQGAPRLRLCLHHRDFEVGKGIVDNIAASIHRSRRTVCVLSRHFLHSDWCDLEMRMATHRLLSEQSHRVILIFLEHISPFELSAFHRLAKLARSRTYLDWPRDESQRLGFWERLRHNIADRDIDAVHGNGS